MLANQPDSAAKVEFAWRIAAGPTLARAANITWQPDGAIVVRASTTAWRDEIARARPIIAARLNQLLGPNVVRAIRMLEDVTCEKP